MNRRRPWSEAHRQLLIEHYPREGVRYVAKLTGRSPVAVQQMATRLGLFVTPERKSQTASAYKPGRDTEEFRAWASNHLRQINERLRASMSDAEWFERHSHAGKTNRAETNRCRAIRRRMAMELVAKTADGDKFSMQELKAFREFLDSTICCDTCRALAVEVPKHRSIYVRPVDQVKVSA